MMYNNYINNITINEDKEVMVLSGLGSLNGDLYIFNFKNRK